MNLDKKLHQWREAGLVDAATVERIAAFERTRQRPVAMYALVGLGAGTVGLGLISLVAANWEQIPAALKLAADLALGVGLAGLVELSLRRQWRLGREAAVTVYFLFTLASLALVGQIYQLDTPTYQALCLWCAATLPLVLLGESRFLGGLYVTGLMSAHLFAVLELLEHLDRDASRSSLLNVGACVLFVSPLLYVLAGQLPWLVDQRPQYALSLRRVGVSAVVLGGLGCALPWYSDVSGLDTLSWGLLVIAAIAAGFSALTWRISSELPGARSARGVLASVVPAAWLVLALSTAFPHEDAGAVAAILQTAWLGVCAYASYRALWLRAFNVLTGLLALRIVGVYFEVFGSLFDTGLGLVVGGLLTLLAGWVWQRKMRKLSARARAGMGGAHVS